MSLSIPKLDEDLKIAKAVLESIDTVMFDCDGVLWTGGKAVDGAVDVITRLKAVGKRVVLVTNNSRRKRTDFYKKILNYGFEVEKEDVFCTPTIASLYLKQNLPPNKKVYLIAEESTYSELTENGIDCIGVGPVELLPPSKNKDMQQELDFNTDPEVGAVVLAYDRYFNLQKCNTALQYLRNPDMLFVATNTDANFPVGDAKIAPGTGSIVAAVKTVAGREPVVLGKPEKPMFEAIQAVHNLDPERTLMVGDRLETDILFGKRNGMKTLAVLTGVTNLKSLAGLKDDCKHELIPDFYMETIGNFLSLI